MLDQFYLPFTLPSFQLRLTVDGIFDVIIHLIVDEFVAFVLDCESASAFVYVFFYASY